MDRPIPILKGKSAERFYNEINTGEISEEQQKYLDYCSKKYKKALDKGSFSEVEK